MSVSLSFSWILVNGQFTDSSLSCQTFTILHHHVINFTALYSIIFSSASYDINCTYWFRLNSHFNTLCSNYHFLNEFLLQLPFYFDLIHCFVCAIVAIESFASDFQLLRVALVFKLKFLSFQFLFFFQIWKIFFSSCFTLFCGDVLAVELGPDVSAVFFIRSIAIWRTNWPFSFSWSFAFVFVLFFPLPSIHLPASGQPVLSAVVYAHHILQWFLNWNTQSNSQWQWCGDI